MKTMVLKHCTVKHVLLLIFCVTLLTDPCSLQAQRRGGNRGGGGRAKPERSNAGNHGGNFGNKAGNSRGGNSNRISNSGNRTNNIGSGNTKIDNSRRNVNINVDNSTHINRNTSVRRNSYRPYARPPYRYGGRRYFCYHPYIYHPFRPFMWGPVWHPWGFFIATLATTAIIVSVNNAQYHYDQGVWYSPTSGGYTAIAAPIGGTITTLPPNSQTVVINETTNNYYYGGTYYEKSDKGYTVVAPTAGAVVDHLPEGGKEVTIGNQKYVKVGETYYQPIEGDKYEVANVEEDK